MPVLQHPIRVVSFGVVALVVGVLSGCGGGGGSPYGGFGGNGGNGGNGGSYPTATPSGTPTTGPTAVPTTCAAPTAAATSGDAVFTLSASCSTANTESGFTIAGDANGLVIAASTADESLVLGAGALQSPPPSGSIEVDLTAGETATALRRRAAKTGRPELDLRARRSSAALAMRRFAHARPIASRKLASLLFASSHGSAAVARKRSILPNTIGSTAGIWTLESTSSGSQYIQVASTLEYSSTYGDVWVDDTLLATSGGPLTTTAIQSIGADYDNAWSAVTPIVGSPDYASSSTGEQETSDCTGSTEPIFIPDSDNRQALFVISSASNGGFGSYFDPANLIYNDVATQCLSSESNERSGSYLQYNLGSSSDTLADQLAEDDAVLPANNLAHLIDFVGHSITNPGTGNDTFLQSGYIETPFIIEGLASFAEDLAIHRMYPQMSIDVDDNGQSAQAYLSDPAAYSMTAFYGTDPGESATTGCNGCFGSAYLFARYAYDRFGASYPSAIVSSGLTGYANLANAFGATTSPENVIGDFSVAMAVSGQGYTTDPRYNVANFTTFGSYTDQSGNGLALTGPTASGTQNAATDMTYAATGGSFLYLQLGGLPAAETIQVTDGTGTLGLEAALSQH